jgi:hydroxymethylpyrimidine pyrophosphatase-like HAD family hydrolase
MAMLIDPLALRTPVAGFNGGIFVKPDMTIMAEHVLPADVARRTMEVILHHGRMYGSIAARTGLFGTRTRPMSRGSNGPSSLPRPPSKISKP